MKIHLVGVGGVAMGNLAAMLKNEGHSVSGSDKGLYPPMSDRLREWGIDAREFDPRNVDGADLCIIGNVISRGNVEVEEILNRNLPYTSMSGALKEFFLKGKEVIVVAGTHGKTTTTFLMDHILKTGHKAPGLFAGGVMSDGTPGFRISDSPYFVIEGDEYDTAFFDKHSKFLHYLPRHLILTSLEFDHADIFANYGEYLTSFRRLLRLIPSEGTVAACIDDEGVREAMNDYRFSPVLWYGEESKKGEMKEKRRKGDEKESPESYRFRREGQSVHFDFPGSSEGLRMDRFSLIGRHNTANALAAALIADKIGIPHEKIREALESFPGVLRRQQIRLRIEELPPHRKQAILMEDFAHHPTAVRETIRAVREAYPGHRIHALFEPRSASSHRKIFQDRYARSLFEAHNVYLCDVFNKHKVPSKERMDVSHVIKSMEERELKKAKKKGKEKGTERRIFVSGKDPETLLNKFKKRFRPSPGGDVILVMSNGSFGGIYEGLEGFLKDLEAKESP